MLTGPDTCRSRPRRPQADGMSVQCCKCYGPADAQVSTGPPDHRWRWWCIPCLIAHQAAARARRRPA